MASQLPVEPVLIGHLPLRGERGRWHRHVLLLRRCIAALRMTISREQRTQRNPRRSHPAESTTQKTSPVLPNQGGLPFKVAVPRRSFAEKGTAYFA